MLYANKILSISSLNGQQSFDKLITDQKSYYNLPNLRTQRNDASEAPTRNP